MKVRDRAATPWLVRPTQIFEAAFNRLIQEHEREAALELLDVFRAAGSATRPTIEPARSIRICRPFGCTKHPPLNHHICHA